MKLSDFRKLIDKLDDNATEDLDVVLEIDPRSNGEHLIDIGEIYPSEITPGKLKIEPDIELFTQLSFNSYVEESNSVFKKIDLRCPKCHNLVGSRDRHCKYCGNALYTAAQNKKALKEDKKELRANAKVLRQRAREERRAMRFIKAEKRAAAKRAKNK